MPELLERLRDCAGEVVVVEIQRPDDGGVSETRIAAHSMPRAFGTGGAHPTDSVLPLGAVRRLVRLNQSLTLLGRDSSRYPTIFKARCIARSIGGILGPKKCAMVFDRVLAVGLASHLASIDLVRQRSALALGFD